MANMTSQTDETARDEARGDEREGAPSPMERAAAGASTLTNQQLRKARLRVDEQIASQRERVSGRVRTLGRALKGAGEMLEEDDLVAQCLHFASDKANGVAGYVDELDPERAAHDLRELAHQRPAWFFGGAFVLGLALGRFARSTAGQLAASAEGSSPGRRVARGSSGRTRASATAPRRAAAPRSDSDEDDMRSGALRP